MKRTLIGLTSAAVLAGSLGAASFGLATGTAQAEPRFVPTYHWCPGDNFRPEWGINWDRNACHDDYRRDRDANSDNGGPVFSGPNGNNGNNYRQGDNDPYYNPGPPCNYFRPPGSFPGSFGYSPGCGGWP